jgi:hypothetical protein
MSPFFAFHTTKNYIYCWAKNSSKRVCVIYWPIILILSIGKVLAELSNGRTSVAIAQIKGILWNLTHLTLIANQRKKVRHLQRINTKNILLTTEIHSCSHLLNWIRNGFQMQYIRQV